MTWKSCLCAASSDVSYVPLYSMTLSFLVETYRPFLVIWVATSTLVWTSFSLAGLVWTCSLLNVSLKHGGYVAIICGLTH